jgi:hypothetical protein
MSDDQLRQSGVQGDPSINRRRGLKDSWATTENPQVAGAPSSVTPRAHGHEAPPRGRRKFLGG